jgi:O-acetyl-ADP-ribose deacetylase (regulator of RNase III)
MKLIFFDLNEDIVQAIKSELAPVLPAHIKAEFLKIDVEDLIRSDHSITGIVSPANCHGWMDGGIDDVYMKLFDGIQERVRQKIAQETITHKVYDYRGDPTLTIGSAISVDLSNDPKDDRILIAAPTMFTPKNIEGTNNVYYATLGLLNILKHETDNSVIAIPGFGTGIGGMKGFEAAGQMADAFSDFYSNRSLSDLIDPKMIAADDPGCFLLKVHACPHQIIHFGEHSSSESSTDSGGDVKQILIKNQ